MASVRPSPFELDVLRLHRDVAVEMMRQALHEQGIGCKPNTIHCHASHRGHAERIVSSLTAIAESRNA